MGDPFRDAALEQMEVSFGTLRRVVDGLPAEALNWEPAGADTNSIAVLATHAMHSTRLLLSIAVGQPPPPRDRPGEFAAAADGPEPLLQAIEGLGSECRAILEGAAVDWAEMRQRERSTGETVEFSAASLLLQAIVHLRGHADEASLTRHVWEARG